MRRLALFYEHAVRGETQPSGEVLACLYDCTGRAVALPLESALAEVKTALLASAKC